MSQSQMSQSQKKSAPLPPNQRNQAVREWPNVNSCTWPLVQNLIKQAGRLRIAVDREKNGTTIIDCGIKVPGCLEAGRLVTEICMGGLGQVAIHNSTKFEQWRWLIAVTSSNPVLACLGSQYAGWLLSEGDFFALGSGPGRARALAEPLYEELGYRDKARSACLVLEVDRYPPATLIKTIAKRCRVSPEKLVIILTPTSSLAGSVQIVGRVLEVGLHKTHEIGFPLERVIDGAGAAPLPPPAVDFISSMGRTNDAIIYGGEIHLFVSGPEDDARDLAHQLPSSQSKDYGRPFAEIFTSYNQDFYAIHGSLFSPAKASVTCLDTGRSFHTGALNESLINTSFG